MKILSLKEEFTTPKRPKKNPTYHQYAFSSIEIRMGPFQIPMEPKATLDLPGGPPAWG